MGGARRLIKATGLSLLLVALMLVFIPALGIGNDNPAGVNSYEVGSANATPINGRVGDTIHIVGTGMLPGEEMEVLFGVRITTEDSDIDYIAEVGTTSSDKSGNWSCEVQIPERVQAYNVVEGAALTENAEGETIQAEEEKRIGNFPLVWNPEAYSYGAAEGINDGEWVYVFEGPWHFAGIAFGEDGGLYGTNTNFIEVTYDDSDEGGYSTSPTSTSNSQLPNTGIPALLIGLCGTGLLGVSYLLRVRQQH